MREGVDVATIAFDNNAPCVELLERKPLGIFPLLDEICFLGRESSTDAEYLERVVKTHKGKSAYFLTSGGGGGGGTHKRAAAAANGVTTATAGRAAAAPRPLHSSGSSSSISSSRGGAAAAAAGVNSGKSSSSHVAAPSTSTSSLHFPPLSFGIAHFAGNVVYSVSMYCT